MPFSLNFTHEQLPLTNLAAWRPRSTLLVGCGGLGSTIVNQTKAKLAEYMSGDSADQSWQDRYSTVRFVSIDTAGYDGDFGTCHLTDAEQIRLPLSKEEVRVLIDSAANPPPYMGWYQPMERERRKDSDLLDRLPPFEAGCGTHRVFGRMAAVKNWADVVTSLRNVMQGWSPVEGRDRFGNGIPAPEDATRTVVVVSSLGGGTGTGIFLDVTAAIHYLQQEAGWDAVVYGVFVLPDATCLRQGMNSFQRANVDANSYAALKELDYLLHGNPFEMVYGDDLQVAIDNRQRRLFNEVFLINRENTAGAQLTSLDQVVDMAAEGLLLTAMTELGSHFPRRQADLVGQLIDPVPVASRGERAREVVRESRLPLFSSLGLATLELPVEGLMKHAIGCQLALDTLAHLQRGGDRGADESRFLQEYVGIQEGCDSPLTQRLGLTIGALTGPDGRFPLGAGAARILTVEQAVGSANPLGRLHEQWEEISLGEEGSPARNGFRQELRQQADDLIRDLFDGDAAVAQPSRVEQLKDEVIRELGDAWADDLLRALRDDVRGCLTRVQEEIGVLRQQVQEMAPLWQEDRKDIAERLTETIRTAPLGTVPAVGGFFRGRHLRRHSRPDLEQYLRAVVDEATLDRDLEVWRAVADLLRQIIDRLGPEIRDEEGREVFWDEAAACLRARMRRACPSSDGPHLQVDAALRHVYAAFLRDLPGEWQPETLARRLRAEGLKMDGEPVPPEDWADRGGTAVAEALIDAVAPAVDAPDTPLYRPASAAGGDPLSVVRRRYWALDLLFRRTGDEVGPDRDLQPLRTTLQQRATEIRKWSAPYVDLDLVGGEGQALDYFISGVGTSRRNPRDPDHWNRFLGHPAHLLPGSHRNRLTACSFLIGFPSIALERADHWRRHYLNKLYAGKNLHLLPGGRDLPEVVLPEYGDLQAARLFALARKHGAVLDLGEGRYYVDSPIPAVRAEFYPPQAEPRPLFRERLVKATQDHRDLMEELCADLLERSATLAEPVRQELLGQQRLLSPARIVELAIDHGVVEGDDTVGYTFDNERPAIRRLFHPPVDLAQGLTEEQFVDRLERNLLLYGEVLEETAERIVERDGQADAAGGSTMERTLNAGGYGVPALDQELEDYLTRPTDS